MENWFEMFEQLCLFASPIPWWPRFGFMHWQVHPAQIDLLKGVLKQEERLRCKRGIPLPPGLVADWGAAGIFESQRA